MRLNLEKCFFGTGRGKFMASWVTQHDIKTNMDKCEAIMHTRSPNNLKELQRLNEKFSSLSIIPKLAEKAKLFFFLLKGATKFNWDQQYENMFPHLKKDITSLRTLASPPSHSTLLLYLAISYYAICSVLAYEEGKKQQPVYFTSRTLQLIEERYQVIEKLVLELVFSP